MQIPIEAYTNARARVMRFEFSRRRARSSSRGHIQVPPAARWSVESACRVPAASEDVIAFSLSLPPRRGGFSHVAQLPSASRQGSLRPLDRLDGPETEPN